MYGNTPPPPGGPLITGGVLATTGIEGLSSLGIVMATLGLLVAGAFLVRTGYLKHTEPEAVHH